MRCGFSAALSLCEVFAWKKSKLRCDSSATSSLREIFSWKKSKLRCDSLSMSYPVPVGEDNTVDGVGGSNSKSKTQWHPMAFFSRKMILAETRYETHNNKLLAIVKALRPGAIIQKIANMRFLFLRTTTTCAAS